MGSAGGSGREPRSKWSRVCLSPPRAISESSAVVPPHLKHLAAPPGTARLPTLTHIDPNRSDPAWPPHHHRRAQLMRKTLRQLARPHLTPKARTRDLHTSFSARAAVAFARNPAPVADRHGASHFQEQDDLAAELFPTWDELGSDTMIGKEEEQHWERVERHEEAIEGDDEEGNAPAPRPAEVEKKVRPTRTAREPGTSSRPAPVEYFHEEDTQLRLGRAPPADSPIKPYRPLTPRASPQPHDSPLLSRYDWRLSSPLSPGRNRTSFDPPNLYRAPKLTKQGHNRLLGVGLEAAMEARRWSGVSEEQWGWKTTVPSGEKGKWASCDAYRVGCVFAALP